MAQTITILSATNRPQANSYTISEIYRDILLSTQQAEVEIADLHTLPADFAGAALYDGAAEAPAYKQLIEKLAWAEKWVFVVGEYNGSFPGVLKTFIDGFPYPWRFQARVTALVGISSGVQGGGLALSHLTDILHYLGVQVLALKPKLSRIEENLTEKKLTNALYGELLSDQAQRLLAF